MWRKLKISTALSNIFLQILINLLWFLSIYKPLVQLLVLFQKESWSRFSTAQCNERLFHGTVNKWKR